jgi:glycosyltransferase involved in cell wall biosynthesis
MALKCDRSISIIFPAYNEEENICEAFEQAVGCATSLFDDWEIIIVNDGSTDRTRELIEELARREPRLITISHDGNGGYGRALRSGLEAASKELVFFCDSDLQFHLSELVLLLTWVERYDIVIGYRVNRQDPLHRRLNAFGWNLLVRLVLGLKVRDIDCAFKLLSPRVLDAIQIDAVGAMVNTDILVQALRLGFEIHQVPVTHFPRMKGNQSGANLRVILKAFRELLQLHRKLSTVPRVVFPHDRRQRTQPIGVHHRRQERRRVNLSINFEDRRLRHGLAEVALREPLRLDEAR